jgi:hypothetical protein
MCLKDADAAFHPNTLNNKDQGLNKSGTGRFIYSQIYMSAWYPQGIGSRTSMDTIYFKSCLDYL